MACEPNQVRQGIELLKSESFVWLGSVGLMVFLAGLLYVSVGLLWALDIKRYVAM